MPCPEWTRLLDRYCALVQTYSEAVLEMRGADAASMDQVREYAEQLRAITQQARLEWEEHERTHRCIRKPVRQVPNHADEDREKTGS